MSTPHTPRVIFNPPVFPGDENKTRQAYYLSFIVPSGIITTVLILMTRLRHGEGWLGTSVLVLSATAVVLLVAWLVARRGAVQLASYITIGVLSLASTFVAVSQNGIRGVGFVSYFLVMLLAGLLLGSRAAGGVAILAILTGFGLAYAESIGAVTLEPDPPFVAAVKYAFLFLMSAFVIRSTIHSLQNALSTAEQNAHQLAASNQELTQLRDDLEVRIQERTASLEKRALQLQAVSSMARSIASIQDLDTLLPNTTRLVSEQFGFYHTGIFLLDEADEYAVLQAANSEGGRRMLARGHRLRLDSNSIVGYVALRGDPRIALDVGADSVYFDNPDLPETRSEMALPLRAGGHVIGVLDVQSRETKAFTQEDIAVLSTLADQVAVAIENVRLYEENQKALAESRSTFESYIRQEWSGFAQQLRHPGFTYDGKQVLPLDKRLKRDHAPTGIVVENPNAGKPSSTISLPIKLRGQVIGVLDVRAKNGSREWTKNEISLLEAAAERAGIALENARLVENAQRRASRERSIGEISARIGAVSDIESILQTAVEELGRKLSSATEVTLELDPEEI